MPAFTKGVEDMVHALYGRITSMGFSRGFSKPLLQSRAATASSSHPSGAMTDRGPRRGSEGVGDGKEGGRGDVLTPRPPLTSRGSTRFDSSSLGVENGGGGSEGKGGGGGPGEEGGEGQGRGMGGRRLKVKGKGATGAGGFAGVSLCVCAGESVRACTHARTHARTHKRTHAQAHTTHGTHCTRITAQSI